MTRLMLPRRTALGAALALPFIAPARAQEAWPARPLRFVVGFAPGGPADVVARIIAQAMGPRLPQPIVVENRVGAGGNIASQYVARAAPDGLNVLFATTSFTVNPAISTRAGYRVEDFVAASIVASTPHMLVVHPQDGARDLAALIALGRQRQLNLAVPGLATTGHLSAERLLRVLGGADLQPVGFPGAAPVVTAVLSRQVDVGTIAMNTGVAQVQAGTVRGLVVTGAERAAALPNVPTAKELGFPDAVDYTWVAAMLPAGTPQPILERINAEIGRALADPEVRARLLATGLDPVGGPQAEAARYVPEEFRRWVEVGQRTGIRIE
jgi:tripartite-type tricarboxylate transporter receptor subunit TctC